MAKRISEQITEYLTLGGDGFTPQTSVPLQVQGHTILGTTQTINNNDNYKANLTTINGHLIINAYYNNHNNYSQGIRINKGADNRTLLMLGGDTNSTEGTNDMTWYIGTFPTAGSSSTTDLIIARGDYQFNYKKPSLQFNDNGLFVYKNLQMKSTAGNNAGFYLYGGNTTDSSPVSYGSLLITTIGTTSTTGVTRLMLGNSTASSSNNNARGLIRLYGSSSRYSDIYSTADSSSKTLYLPNAAGWLIVGGNGSSTGVGSSSQPIYINTSGVATAITGTIDNNAKTATAANITTTTNAIAYYTNTSGTFGTKASTNGALYATSTNGSLEWGTLPIAQGGTNATSFSTNRLVSYSGSALTSLNSIYVETGKLAINKTSITSGYIFEVNGTSLLKTLDIDGNCSPYSTNTYNLGNQMNTWANLYVNNLKGSSIILDGYTNINTFSDTDHPLSNSKFTGNSNILQIDNGDVYINNNCEINNRLVATNLEVRSQSNAMYVPMVSYSTYNFNSAPENRLPLTILLPQNISPSNSYFITFMIDVLQVSGLVCYYIMMDWFEGDFSSYETQAYRLGKAHSNNNNRPDLRTILFFRLIESNTNIQRLGICLGYSQSDVIFNQLKFIRVRDVHIYKKGTNTEINCDDYATDWVIYSSQPQEVLSHTGNIYNNYLLGNANSTAGFPSLV